MLRVPLVVAIGGVGAAYILSAGLPAGTVAPLVANAIDSGVLLAIPLYLLAGDLMNASGATHRLVDFASALLVPRARAPGAHRRGHLAHLRRACPAPPWPMPPAWAR
jgi:hypothetical protein